MDKREREIEVLAGILRGQGCFSAPKLFAKNILATGLVTVKVPLTNVERLEKLVTDSPYWSQAGGRSLAEFLDSKGVRAEETPCPSCGDYIEEAPND